MDGEEGWKTQGSREVARVACNEGGCCINRDGGRGEGRYQTPTCGSC